MISSTPVTLRIAVILARWGSLHRPDGTVYDSGRPRRGDLVVECTHWRPDPDAIGTLLEHGDAPYNTDGTGAVREVWDIAPLNPHARMQVIACQPMQRWENADFRCVPSTIAQVLYPAIYAPVIAPPVK